jgi:hypothetical protein
MSVFANVWLVVLLVCALLGVCITATIAIRYRHSYAKAAAAVLPLSIETASPAGWKRTRTPGSTTTITTSSTSMTSCASISPLDTPSKRTSGSSVRYSFGPHSISTCSSAGSSTGQSSSQRNRQWSPAAISATDTDVNINAGANAGANADENNCTPQPRSRKEVAFSRKAPWAPYNNNRQLDPHAEESIDYEFIEQFDSDTVTSYEQLTSFCFDRITDACVERRQGLRQWIKHVQLQHNALGLRNGQPRALVPPHVQMMLKTNDTNTRGPVPRVPIDTVQRSILYTSALIKTNAAMRKYPGIGTPANNEASEKHNYNPNTNTAEDAEESLTPINIVNRQPAEATTTTGTTTDVAVEDTNAQVTRQCYDMLATATMHTTRPEPELGYTIKRYYSQPTSHEDSRYNTTCSSNTLPHPSDLARLKKQLFT